ncbi:MAG: hypothetical protein IT349_05015 [Candidatus Eisenbacteria bacterium]|nr:hypothetical protein [Candidatus Eisenbacteria bacterium]MCC7141444.1 hypothetical protein [Candidatus Eisenbacteria bacterium]
MICDRFRAVLSRYVRGELVEPEFGAAVEHEAICSECREAALLAWEAVEGGETVATTAPLLPLESLLARTTGSDCSYVELRVAEDLDEPLEVALRARIEDHLGGCASCRRMREILHELPAFYALYPVLKPDRAFTREILDRTIGPRPGFLEIVRTLWRRPEAVFEAAVACALVTVLIFGRSQPDYTVMADRAEQLVSEQLQKVVPERASVHGVRDVLAQTGTSVGDFLAPRDGHLRRRVDGVYTSAVKVSSWMERAGIDLRNGDYQALLSDLRGVLGPLGLYPKPRAIGEAPETGVEDDTKPRGKTDDSVPSQDAGTR